MIIFQKEKECYFNKKRQKKNHAKWLIFEKNINIKSIFKCNHKYCDDVANKCLTLNDLRFLFYCKNIFGNILKGKKKLYLKKI